MLRLPDHWVWDSWPVRDDDGAHHLFFLRASRALVDPERRHRRAGIGHARSGDLVQWELLPDALVTADEPAWDDGATWTGSVVRADDGTWRLFYTGVSRAEGWLVQRVGVAESDDLVTWRRRGAGPVTEADARWYEKLSAGAWFDEAWRDPWVFRGDDGLWHMLVTARSAAGNPAAGESGTPAAGDSVTRAVIGHAVSADLDTWEVRPPLSEPAGWGQMEVPQTAVVDGVPFLIFCCADPLQDPRRSTQATGGMWFVPGESLLGPWDFDAAGTFDHPSLYAARLIERAPEEWVLLGFSGTVGGAFQGEILDPIPVVRDGLALRLA